MRPRSALWISALGTLALTTAGCGADERAAAADCGVVRAAADPAKNRKLDQLAGRLQLDETDLRPGGSTRYRIYNTGQAELWYGAPFRVERLAGEQWVDADDEFFGSRQGWTLEGNSAPPDTAGLWHRIRVPRELADGSYRIVKTVSDRLGRGGPKLPLCAEFQVQEQ